MKTKYDFFNELEGYEDDASFNVRKLIFLTTPRGNRVISEMMLKCYYNVDPPCEN